MQYCLSCTNSQQDMEASFLSGINIISERTQNYSGVTMEPLERFHIYLYQSGNRKLATFAQNNFDLMTMFFAGMTALRITATFTVFRHPRHLKLEKHEKNSQMLTM